MDMTKTKVRSLTDWLRQNFKWFLEPMGAFIGKLGIHPNYLTLGGLLGNVLGAAALAYGHITLGGIIILLMGPVDALDGATARASGEKSPFGAFADSVTDRYSEAVIYLGLLIYYLQQPGNFTPLILIFLAFVG